ncbi:MAG: neocarzinostatin apoprotein domain-containing protein [Acidimicrobiia bacterium]
MRQQRVLGIALAIALVGGALAASAPANATASAATATLVVTPGGTLTDGQVVSVNGSGFAPSSPLNFFECNSSDCEPLPQSIVTDAVGSFRMSWTARRGIVTSGTEYDCALGWCQLGVAAPSDPELELFPQDMSARVDLTFGPSPTMSISPSSGLADGQTVTVTGEHLAPGQTVHAWECQEYGLLCTKPLDREATVDAAGRVSFTVPLVRWIHDYMDDFGDLPMDCAAVTCHLALTLEGYYEDGYVVLTHLPLHFAPTPGLAAAGAQVYEGQSGTRQVAVPFALSFAGRRARTVRYRTLAWSAQADDFVATRGRVSVPAGVDRGVVQIDVRGDTTPEPSEVFLVEIRGTGRLRDLRAFAPVWVLNDD